jgi:hypothetical protein
MQNIFKAQMDFKKAKNNVFTSIAFCVLAQKARPIMSSFHIQVKLCGHLVWSSMETVQYGSLLLLEGW